MLWKNIDLLLMLSSFWSDTRNTKYDESISSVKSTPVVQWSSYSPLDSRFAGSNPAGVDGFSERKNPEYDFLRKGSKAVGPVS